MQIIKTLVKKNNLYLWFETMVECERLSDIQPAVTKVTNIGYFFF